MSIAELLEKKQREVLATEVFEKKPRSLKVIPHYLRNEDISVRFPYLVGLAMISNVDGKLTAKKQAKLKKIAMSLEVPEQHLDQVFKAAKEVYSETVDNIVGVLTTQESKVAFLLDLYKVGIEDGKVGTSEQSVIKQFADLLQLKPIEKKNLHAFAMEAMGENVENNILGFRRTPFKLPEDVLRQFLYGLEFQTDKKWTLKRDFLLMRVCYYQNRINEAVELCRKAVGEEHAASQTWLGYFYEKGIGVKENSVVAARWYRVAAKQGFKEAQCMLGDCYSQGEGVKYDEAEAAKWYRKAAKQGYGEAQYKMGNCYAYGEGVIESRAEAMKWYAQAAEQGHAEAKRCLKKIKR